jgi:hypothetical protein
VFLEGQGWAVFQERPEDVRRYAEIFRSAQEHAICGPELVEMLDEVIGSLQASVAG